MSTELASLRALAARLEAWRHDDAVSVRRYAALATGFPWQQVVDLVDSVTRGAGWWHPPECIDLHDADHNCLDTGGSIIGWREAVQ